MKELIAKRRADIIAAQLQQMRASLPCSKNCNH